MGEVDEKLDGKKKVQWSSKKHVLNRIKVFVGHFGLFVALIIYTGIGALVFQVLEQEEEEVRRIKLKQELTEGRLNLIQIVLNNSIEAVADFNSSQILREAFDKFHEIIANFTKEGMTVGDYHNPEKTTDWEYFPSAFFASTVLTTIGYGNMAPKTTNGRAFCIGFALIGIPFTLTVIADLGKLMASAVSSSYKSCRRHFPKKVIKSSSKLSKFFGTSNLHVCLLPLLSPSYTEDTEKWMMLTV